MASFEKAWSPTDFLGNDVEEAYAQIFGAGKPEGGVGDAGKDVATGEREIPYVQIKSSWDRARVFLAKSLERKKFIPLCVGEPGSKEEMLASIREFGAWLAKDIPNRDALLPKIKEIRDIIVPINQTGGKTFETQKRP